MLSVPTVKYKLTTTRPGVDFGLRLLLVVNQSDYLVTSSAAAGFVVSLHEPDEVPFLPHHGLKVSAGFSTSVAVRMKEVGQCPFQFTAQ